MKGERMMKRREFDQVHPPENSPPGTDQGGIVTTNVVLKSLPSEHNLRVWAHAEGLKLVAILAADPNIGEHFSMRC
jgi:hypothetical protein